METSSQNEKEVIEWRFKRQIDYLQDIILEPSTSAISFFATPNDSIPRIKQFFSSEMNKANQIKTTKNKQAVQTALGNIQEILRDISIMPIMGLACFAIPHFIDPNTNQSRRLILNIELPSAVQEYLYNCSNRIITEPLKKILRSEPIFGYIVVDGNCALFAEVQGKQKHILQKISVNLPRKHNKGGQSRKRFLLLRNESRFNYLKKVAEIAESHFIRNNLPIVQSLIIAGDAQFKNELQNSSNLHLALQKMDKYIITTSYGGERGLEEAIKQSAEIITECKLTKEISLINSFLELLYQGEDDMITYTVKETVDAFMEGAVKTIIVWENLNIIRQVSKKSLFEDDSYFIEYLNPEQRQRNTDVVESGLLIDWLLETRKTRGTDIKLVSDSTREGKMLRDGFEGIAGFLRYKRTPIEETNVVNNEDLF